MDIETNKIKPLRVLSLFDGISCGQVALERAGIPVEVYYASEIDKYAIQITQKNYPNTIQLGDVTKIDFSKFIGKIDLLIGGSPCQDLSIAGKRKGLQGERSGLFYKFAEAVKMIKPKYWLLENNYKMPKEAYQEISKIMGCYPTMINSSLVSAQDRKRYYWTNIKLSNYSDINYIAISNLPQPENRKIYLSDVVEIKTNRPHIDKICMQKINTTVKVRKHNVDTDALKRLLREHKKISNKEIANKLNVPITKVEHWFRTDRCFAIPDAELWYKLKDILNIKDNSFDKSITEFEIRSSKYDMANRIYHIAGKSPTLTTCTGGHQRKIIVDDDGNLYLLSPIHCERLQTIPDNYTEGISDTQRYKCLGNGWTVDVIAHIFSHLKMESSKCI